MLVNSAISGLSPLLKSVIGFVIAACIGLIFSGFITNGATDKSYSRRANLAVRDIGHNLLLRAGDSISVIPPVIEKSNGIFILQFENEFAFQPDTLIAIAQRSLSQTGLAKYTLTVQKCDIPEIVYGFEINPPDNSIQACRGRSQPKACYTIEVAFADFPSGSARYQPILPIAVGVLAMLAIVLASRKIVSKNRNLAARERDTTITEKELIAIGKFKFDATELKLTIGQEAIPLTDKESRILVVLTQNFGQLTLRERLIQEIWTDEGVITGRSLDMFISKLRKKLAADPNLSITNIHGKGYKLEDIG